MPTQEQQPPQVSTRSQRLLATRQGVIMVAAGAALLGGAILILFLNAYRDSVEGSDGTKEVLVAKVLIERGSPADSIADSNMYDVVAVEESDVDDGAVEDPADIRGKVTQATIYPGEQITSTDFRGQSGSLGDQIRGRERAISLPFATHGALAGDLRDGDHVDVIGLFRLDPQESGRDRPVSRILLQDALVLKAPDADSAEDAGADTTHAVVLRGTDEEATELAFSAEFGRLWLALRPKAGAKEISRPSATALENIVFGLPPIPLSEFRRQFRRSR